MSNKHFSTENNESQQKTEASENEALLEDLHQHKALRDARVRPMSEAENRRTTIIVVALGVALLGAVVLAFVLTFASNRGYFEEGVIGLFVGNILKRMVYLLCLLPIPFILYRHVYKTKVMRVLLIGGVLVLTIFAFRNPVMDVAALNQPHSIQLDNAYLDFNRGGRRNSYFIRGSDATGQLQSFSINKKRFYDDRQYLRGQGRSVTIYYLPHTETVMSVRYEPVQQRPLS